MIGPDNTTPQPYGIDTSVLVRLVTAEPELDFQHCVESLRALIDQNAEWLLGYGSMPWVQSGEPVITGGRDQLWFALVVL